MSLVEERKKLIEAVAESRATRLYPSWEKLRDDWRDFYREGAAKDITAISAAGFSIVGPEVTEEMDAAGAKSIEQIGDAETVIAGIFKAMLAAGDLGRKPE